MHDIWLCRHTSEQEVPGANAEMRSPLAGTREGCRMDGKSAGVMTCAWKCGKTSAQGSCVTEAVAASLAPFGVETKNSTEFRHLRRTTPK